MTSRDRVWTLAFTFRMEKAIDPIWAFWIYTVPVSKALEMGDTLFIVLRKRRLMFLHYYHHALACIVASFALNSFDGTYIFYATMNTGIHALMYFYFALKTAGVHIPLSCAMILTTVQISQFFVAIFLQICVCFHILSGNSCQLSFVSSVTTFFMYVTFCVLFVNFFRAKYILKEKPKIL